MLLGIRWEHKFNIHTGWTRKGNHYLTQGKHNFISKSINKLKTHPIVKSKGKIMLKLESILIVEVQAPQDISGNKKYHLNTSCSYESIPKRTLLGTFELVDDEISEIHTTRWTKLEGQICQAHAQLRRKRGYKRALQKASKEEKESPEVLPEYPTDSSMEMETLMKNQR